MFVSDILKLCVPPPPHELGLADYGMGTVFMLFRFIVPSVAKLILFCYE